MKDFKKIKETIDFAIQEKITKKYNDEMVKKTWYYQKKFNFETNPKKGNEFWNVEADAFKHAFGSADLCIKYGDLGSTLLGIGHEYETPNNPKDEWNMDSWNNNQGREIAKEIEKEYGNKFMSFSQQKQDDIIAAKVINRMRRGELITNPKDERVYKGWIENQANKHPNIVKKLINAINNNQPTGFATPIKPNHIYTREEINKMTTDEFAKHENAIMKQMREKGIPTNSQLQKHNQKSSAGNSAKNSNDGRWVTINGNHVLIKD